MHHENNCQVGVYSISRVFKIILRSLLTMDATIATVIKTYYA